MYCPKSRWLPQQYSLQSQFYPRHKDPEVINGKRNTLLRMITTFRNVLAKGLRRLQAALTITRY